MSIRTKLLLGIGVIVLLLLAVIAAGRGSIQAVVNESRTLVADTAPTYDVITKLDHLRSHTQATAFELVIARMLAKETNLPSDQRVAQEKRMAEEQKEFDHLCKELRATIARLKGDARFEALGAATERFDVELTELVEHAARAGSLRELQHRFERIGQQDEAVDAQALAIGATVEKELADHVRRVSSLGQSGARNIVVVSLLAVVGVSGVGVLLYRSITVPLAQLRETAAKLGAGDRGARASVRSRDELGQLASAFNQMAESLSRAETTVREAAAVRVRTERLAAIGELAGGVAHELRNPLAAIKNSAYYIRSRLEGSELLAAHPRVGEFMEIMDREIKTSNQLVTDLMDFARVNPPTLTPTNLATVVDNALSRVLLKDTVTITRDLPPALPELPADGEQLHRVFTNLIQNAEAAMPEGGTLTISARVTDDAIELQFRDTGEGISEPDLSRVFSPLFTTKAQGIGLGLTVVRGIVERHRGTIGVESVPGRGTTFTIRLPRTSEPAA